ncbi:hypothetical protein SteCoe_12922 [Stentor coeruleus]|uniref:Uncharacterized protein n=1 Tax=Stentor coeruleus TaxID=5963 RepID=A0A1R2C9Q2_9CILI|nr:hypothetical protein SteCoe_12922 [Stentor coeruleus]
MKACIESSTNSRRPSSKFHKFLGFFMYLGNSKHISAKLFSCDFKRQFYRAIQLLVLLGQEDLYKAVCETCDKSFFFWSKNSHKRSKRLGELLKSNPDTSQKINKIFRNSTDLMGLFEYIFNIKYIGEEARKSVCAEEILDLYIPVLSWNVDEDIVDSLLDLPSTKVDILCKLLDEKKFAAFKPSSKCRSELRRNKSKNNL